MTRMNSKYFSLTKEAIKDLSDIWLRIADDNIAAAEMVSEDFEDAFLKLAQNPYMGTKRQDMINIPARIWVVHSYYIIYNPEGSPLQILRIISAYRNIKNCYLGNIKAPSVSYN